jgi:hypothetical protein
LDHADRGLRALPEPGLVVALVAGVASLAAFNISRREKYKRLTLERRKKENLRSAASLQRGAGTVSTKNDPIV